MDQVLFEKRDATIGQAQNIVTMMKELGIQNAEDYKQTITEILTQAFPQTGASVNTWAIDVSSEGGAETSGGLGGL